MVRYDYQCSKCDLIFEEMHSMLEKPIIHCPLCRAISQKMFGLPHTHQDKLYDFTDINTTGKPIKFSSKGQWQKHLKKLGMHDDVKQSPRKSTEFKTGESRHEKEKRKKEYKEVLGEVYKEVRQTSGKV